jgi:hypothetical protein
VVHSAVEAVRQGRLAPTVRTGQRGAAPLSASSGPGSSPARLEIRPGARYGYPRWLIERLQADWPQDWSDILPPATARHRCACGSIAATGRVSRPGRPWSMPGTRSGAGFSARCPVPRAARGDQPSLPGFAEGGLSVQDGAAQLAVEYLGLAMVCACLMPVPPRRQVSPYSRACRGRVDRDRD